MPRSRAASTNQGILVTPFHSMLLICPATTAAHVERYLSAFGAFCRQLASLSAQA
jgi:glutamate-1-semialdehyde 2,1-aminomutase